MKLGLSLGYAPPGTNPADLFPLVQEAERARLRLRLGRGGLGHRRRQRPRLARGEDGADQARLGDHADPRPHSREHGDDGGDARPPLRRPLPARARHLGAAGGRGLARPAVGQAARQDARVRRDRPRSAAAGRRRARGRALPDPVGRPGRDRARQAAEADAAPAARRDPDLPRGAGAEERRPRGRDRRRLAPDLRRARALRRRLRAEPRGRAAGLRDRGDGERVRRRRRGGAPRRAPAARRALRRRHGRKGPELLQLARPPLRLGGGGRADPGALPRRQAARGDRRGARRARRRRLARRAEGADRRAPRGVARDAGHDAGRSARRSPRRCRRSPSWSSRLGDDGSAR